MKKYLCVMLLIFPVILFAQTEGSRNSFGEFADKYIADALDSLEIPALSIAIIKNDETVYIRGFGRASTGSKTTPSTTFYIASCTKSFTALAAALLDSKRLICLDEPMAKFFPELQFEPVIKDDSISLRHLLTHTSGIENDGMVFRTAYSGEYSVDQLIQLIPASNVNKAGFGNFKYDNIGYNIYSLVMIKALNKQWQKELSDVIFDPLNMSRTTAYASQVREEMWECALPYSVFGEKGPVRIPIEKSDATMHAAGGMYSTAHDLSRWLRIQINDGKLDGKQIFPGSVIRETRRLQAVTNSDFGPFKRIGYGLGWYIGLYDKDTLIHHFGGFPGYHSHISFMPDKKMGVAILVNDNTIGAQWSNILASFSYDCWQGKPNAVEEYKMKLDKLVSEKKQMSEKIATDREQQAARKWQFNVSFEKLNGLYEHFLYGRFAIKAYENSVSVSIAGLACEARPFKTPNSIRVELIPGQGEVITFNTDPTGHVQSLQYQGKVFMKIE